MDDTRLIAYFSMEIALDPSMPTYSGGLGVLAGDTIKAAADLQVPMVAITLLYRKGYFYQHLDRSGWQTEEPAAWDVADFLEEMPVRASGTIEGQGMLIRSWKCDVVGVTGYKIPVYFLDTDIPENPESIRVLTHYLYGGDQKYRFCQEAILGIGGIRMLHALGYNAIEKFHMNEGHSSLLTLELLKDQAERNGRESVNKEDIETVKKKCIFTTHTPVPAGHDQFTLDLVLQVLGHRQDFFDMKDVFCTNIVGKIFGKDLTKEALSTIATGELKLNMTYLALNFSHYVNGVAKKHGEISNLMFAGYHIDAITNGVHATSWVCKPLSDLYDRHMPGWRQDNFSLRSALSIPHDEMWNAHMEAKKQFLYYVNRETNAGMDKDTFTIGFARRATAYKRGDLLFSDLQRLRTISAGAGPIQIIYAGKAHPNDQGGKEIIQRIFQYKETLKNEIKVAYLENYDLGLAKQMVAGVDIWLNTPEPPMEASGTSGMKAAVNGVPSLSILDGWWIEGCIEGITGWSIGETAKPGIPANDGIRDAASLYDTLEAIILPLFYHNRRRFVGVMRHTVALNGSFFNTHRMLQQYVMNAYFK